MTTNRFYYFSTESNHYSTYFQNKQRWLLHGQETKRFIYFLGQLKIYGKSCIGFRMPFIVLLLWLEYEEQNTIYH